MILFDLRCAAGHGFEAWFRNGDAYESQAAAGEIVCPVCGGTEVTKAPMAPRIAKSRSESDAASGPENELRRKLAELRAEVEANCDYVGDRFADEARRIHYGETDARGIYGEATEREARELHEEGIAVSRIPWLRRTDS